MDLTQFYHILDKLQTSTIQSYIINLGREYSRLLDEDLNMKQVIEKGSEILNKLFIKRLVVKENTSDGKVSKIMITPKLDITLSDRIKFYPIETEIPEYNRQSYTLNDKRYGLILHNQFGISKVSTKCLDTIKKLSSIPIQIDSSLSDWTRIPKNIEALEQENFKKESDLFRNTQKEYHNKIVYFYYRFDNRGRMYNNGLN